MTPVVLCVFCGTQTGRGYQIDPFGRACPSCTDAFFTSRSRKGWTGVTEADLAKVTKAQLGPPYSTRYPLKIDVSDTGKGRTIQTVGYGQPDRVGGRGLYVYRGEFMKRVFVKAQAPGDSIRKRLNLHTDEYQKVVPRVAWIVYQQTSGKGKTADVKGYFVISTQRMRELSRRYQTPFGVRIGPPLEACSHYDPDFFLKDGPTGLAELDALAKLPVGVL